MRRGLKLLVGGVVVAIAAVAVFVLFALGGGGIDLEHGARLAAGRVEVVADGFIAAYIIDLDDGSVALVDAGFDTDAALILASLDKAGRSPSDVSAILFTHGHGDHIAGALAFPDATLYSLEADADLVEGRRTADNLLGRYKPAELTGLVVHRVLDDGEILTIGGTPVEVFAVPGHSRGSGAYLIHSVLFMGDSAAAAADGTISAAPPVFSADREQNRRALHSLASRLANRSHDVSTMVFGHQGPLAGIEPLIEWSAENQ